MFTITAFICYTCATEVYTSWSLSSVELPCFLRLLSLTFALTVSKFNSLTTCYLPFNMCPLLHTNLITPSSCCLTFNLYILPTFAFYCFTVKPYTYLHYTPLYHSCLRTACNTQRRCQLLGYPSLPPLSICRFYLNKTAMVFEDLWCSLPCYLLCLFKAFTEEQFAFEKHMSDDW